MFNFKKITSSFVLATMILTMLPTTSMTENIKPIQEVEAATTNNLDNIKIYSKSSLEELQNLTNTALEQVEDVSPYGMSISVWHHSGGYWRYTDRYGKPIDIKDDKFKGISNSSIADLNSTMTLESYETEFEIKKGTKLDKAIRDGKEVVLNINSKEKKAPLYDLFAVEKEYDENLDLYNIKTNKDGTIKTTKNSRGKIDSGFDVEIGYNKGKDTYSVIVTALPKLNYYFEDQVSYDIYNLNLKKHVPFVKNGFGYNAYSMHPQSSEQLVRGWFDFEDPFNIENMPSGYIHPTMIRPYNDVDVFGNHTSTVNGGGLMYKKTPLYYSNSDGILNRGKPKTDSAGNIQTKEFTLDLFDNMGSFKKKITTTEYNIGSGTFTNAGAVGLVFVYPIQIQAYIKGEPKVVVSYVKATGVNSDGSLKLEEFKKTEIENAEFDEKGALIIEERKDLLDDGVTAVLNDVITTPVDLTETDEKITWEEMLPETPSREITVEDIWRYQLGRLTGVIDVAQMLGVPETSKLYNYYESSNTIVTNIFDSLLGFKNAVSSTDKEEYGKKVVEAFKKLCLSLSTSSSQISPETETEIVKNIMLSNGIPKEQAEKFAYSAVRIENLDEVFLDTAPPTVPVAQVIKNYSDNTIEIPNFAAGSGSSIAYLRYIVFPVRTEIIIQETYKDNVLIKSDVLKSVIPLVEISDGVYDDTVTPTNVASTDPSFKLVEWATSKETPLLSTIPSSPIKSGITYQPIAGVDTDENVYVKWRKDIVSGVSSSSYLVPEWRLSKYYPSQGYNQTAYMGLVLSADDQRSCKNSTLVSNKLGTTVSSYLYNTMQPKITGNSIPTDKDYNPTNYKYSNWLHTKALTEGSYIVSHANSSVDVSVTGTLNLIKSTDLSGLKLANWVTGNTSYMNLFDLDGGNIGTAASLSSLKQTSDLLEYGIINLDSYTHYITHYSHPRINGIRRCRCYRTPETPLASYNTADYRVESSFEIYRPVNTDTRLVKAVSTKLEANGKTAVAKQEGAVLNVYPEIAMYFANDAGTDSIKFAVGDMIRKIQPISYHTMKYDVFVKPVTNGTSIATSIVAKQKANTMGYAGKQVIHKGAGANTTFEVTNVKGSNNRGTLTVKTYALDVANAAVKNVWGNNGYSTSVINDNFLNSFSFRGVASSHLLIGSYTGPDKLNSQLAYTKGNTTSRDHTLVVRGGLVKTVNGTPVNNVNADLKEALANMKLIVLDASGNVVADKANTVFNTFEHQTGKPLTEPSFATAANTARGLNGVEAGSIVDNQGWYSEDSTILKVTEYTTVYTVPNTMFADKIPMTVAGLTTPIDKNKFYDTMLTGHTYLKYNISNTAAIGGIGAGTINSYFEVESKTNGSFNDITVDYLTPNVSVSDTMNFN